MRMTNRFKKIILASVLCLVMGVGTVFASGLQVGVTVNPTITVSEIGDVFNGEKGVSMSNPGIAPYVKGEMGLFYADMAAFFDKGDSGVEVDVRAGGGLQLSINNAVKFYLGGAITAGDSENANFSESLKSAKMSYSLGLGIPAGAFEFIGRCNIPTDATVRSILKEFKGFRPHFKNSTLELAAVYTF